MTDFAFYHDAGLTQPVASGTPVLASQFSDGSVAYVDVQIWLGSTDDTKKLQRESDPGVDTIDIAVSDAASGSGEPVTAVKLAQTQGGLAGATAGAALTGPHTILGGVANAWSFWARLDDQTGVVGVYDDLSLTTADLIEPPV